MPRRRHSSPVYGNALLVAMLVCIQLLLPVVHAQHLASHAKVPHTTASSCCHHHHDQPEQPDSPDDESCTLCVELAVVRHGSVTLDGPSLLLGLPHSPDIVPLAPVRSPLTPGFSTGAPRGPPTA